MGKKLCGQSYVTDRGVAVDVGGYPLWGVGAHDPGTLRLSPPSAESRQNTFSKASNAMLLAVTSCHLNNLLRNKQPLSTVAAVLS